MEKEITIEKSCLFTGHRSLREDFDLVGLKRAIFELIKKGVDTFYCGMAVGFDMLAGEVILKAREKFPSIKLIACIPFVGQEKYYDEEDKKRYASLLESADERVIISDRFSKASYLKRNRYMADRSKYMIAYLKEKSGGTAMTVDYFKTKKDVEIIYIK